MYEGRLLAHEVVLVRVQIGLQKIFEQLLEHPRRLLVVRLTIDAGEDQWLSSWRVAFQVLVILVPFEDLVSLLANLDHAVVLDAADNQVDLVLWDQIAQVNEVVDGDILAGLSNGNPHLGLPLLSLLFTIGSIVRTQQLES
jgi:hypothetical protein